MKNQVESTTTLFSLRNLPLFSALFDSEISVKFYYFSIVMKSWLFVVFNKLTLKNKSWLLQDSLVSRKNTLIKSENKILTSRSRCLYGRSRDKIFSVRFSLSFKIVFHVSFQKNSNTFKVTNVKFHCNPHHNFACLFGITFKLVF